MDPSDLEKCKGVDNELVSAIRSCRGVCGLDTPWDVLAPLPIGKVEFDGDPSAAGGPASGPPVHLPRVPRSGVASELVSGGIARWQRVKPQRSGAKSANETAGHLRIQPNADWNDLAQSLSRLDALEFQGWAVGHLVVGVGVGKVEISCQFAPEVWLVRGNGRLERLATDVYGGGESRSFLGLESGVHLVYARVRGRAEAMVGCRAREVWETGVALVGMPFVPDIVMGAVTDAASVGLPHTGSSTRRSKRPGRRQWDTMEAVTNASALVQDQWAAVVVSNVWGVGVRNFGSEVVEITGGTLKIGELSFGLRVATQRHKQVDGVLHPGVLRYVPVVVDEGSLIHLNRRVCETEVVARLDLSLDTGESIGTSVSLRCRGLDESFRLTYLAPDGAVAEAGVIAPLPLPVDSVEYTRGVPVLVSFHGTGVTATGQADAYKLMMEPRRKVFAVKFIDGKWTKSAQESDEPYTFGVEGAWVLAPSRHGAHNWEGIGVETAQSARTALVQMVAMIHTVESSNVDPRLWRLDPTLLPPVDLLKTLIAGQSMGGHGALVAAAKWARDVAGVWIGAGWPDAERYGDGNMPSACGLGAADHILVPTRAAQTGVRTLDAGNSVTWADLDFAAGLEHDGGRLAPAALSGLGLPGNSSFVPPVHIRVGSLDKTVHAYWSRKIARTFALHGAAKTTTLEEVPNQAHFWWDTKRSNDGGQANDAIVRRSMAAVLRKGAPTLSSALRQCPNVHVTYTAIASGIASLPTADVIVRSSFTPARESKIGVRYSCAAHDMALAVSNVAHVYISEPVTKLALVHFDTGEPLSDCNTRFDVEFCISRDQTSCIPCPSHRPPPPLRSLLTAPPTIIIGTLSESLQPTLQNIAFLLADAWRMAGHGDAPILFDQDISSLSSLSGSVLLLGGPTLNSLTPSGSTPYLEWHSNGDTCPGFTVTSSSLAIGGGAVVPTLDALTHGLLTTIDARAHPTAVLHSCGIHGLYNAASAMEHTVPPMTRMPLTAHLPAYIIAGPETRLLGAKGWISAGYY